VLRFKTYHSSFAYFQDYNFQLHFKTSEVLRTIEVLVEENIQTSEQVLEGCNVCSMIFFTWKPLGMGWRLFFLSFNN